jgi:hypothetical protein
MLYVENGFTPFNYKDPIVSNNGGVSNKNLYFLPNGASTALTLNTIQ